MKGFKDSKKKFHPINSGKKGVRKSRIDRKPLDYKDPELIKNAGIPITTTMLKTGRRFKRDKKSEFEPFAKNMDHDEQFWLGRLDTILYDPKLEMTSDEVVAKIHGEIAKPIFEYRITDKLKLKPNSKTDPVHGKIYWDFASNTDITEKSLKRIAVDANLEKLIPNSKISTLLDKATFQTHKERANRPIVISIKNTNWIVAPYDKAYAEEQKREIMKAVVAEHKAEHERNQQ